jgi:hypothetical protein
MNQNLSKDRVFVAYKHTGADHQQLKQALQSVSKLLEELGYNPFIYWRDKQNWQLNTNQTRKEIITQALEEVERSQLFIALIFSNELSEGLVIEAARALDQGIKIVLAIAENVGDSHLKYTRSLADQEIRFNADDTQDLLRAIRSVFVK